MDSPHPAIFIEDTQLAYAALESQLSFVTVLEASDESNSSTDKKATYSSPAEQTKHRSEIQCPSQTDGTTDDAKNFKETQNDNNTTKPPPTAVQSQKSESSRKSQQQNKQDPTSKSITAEHPSESGVVTAENTALSKLSTSIHPPTPETSIDRFSTHVTPALRHLADTSAVAKCFAPCSTTRETDRLERGHWLIENPTWPIQLQIDFWTFLEKFLHSGAAGWGVWCTRENGDEIRFSSDPSPAESKLENHPPCSRRTDTQGLGAVRVYCWGEIVEHIYLLLYVASSSKVRKHGLRWVDAEGKVVVKMREA